MVVRIRRLREDGRTETFGCAKIERQGNIFVDVINNGDELYEQ